MSDRAWIVKYFERALGDLSRRIDEQDTTGLRDQIIRERGSYVTRELHDQLERGLSERLNSIERWQNRIVGVLVFITFIIPLVVGLLAYHRQL